MERKQKRFKIMEPENLRAIREWDIEPAFGKGILLEHVLTYEDNNHFRLEIIEGDVFDSSLDGRFIVRWDLGGLRWIADYMGHSSTPLRVALPYIIKKVGNVFQNPELEIS